MEIISSVVNKIFPFSRLSSENNARRSKKMEEKALEVYGKWCRGANRLPGKTETGKLLINQTGSAAAC